MKKIYLFLFATLTPFFNFGQTPCENGFALNYPCNGFDLQSHISLDEMNANGASDSWGWTDPEDGSRICLGRFDKWDCLY